MSCKILKYMIRKMNLKNYFYKYFILFICIFIASGFLINPENEFSRKTMILKVEQESDDIAVSVKADINNKIQFYMFNVEGKMIKEITINGSKKINISHLEKGIYIYDFFANDERLKNGKIELK
jgi:hypothetical protein